MSPGHITAAKQDGSDTPKVMNPEGWPPRRIIKGLRPITVRTCRKDPKGHTEKEPNACLKSTQSRQVLHYKSSKLANNETWFAQKPKTEVARNGTSQGQTMTRPQHLWLFLFQTAAQVPVMPPRVPPKKSLSASDMALPRAVRATVDGTTAEAWDPGWSRCRGTCSVKLPLFHQNSQRYANESWGMWTSYTWETSRDMCHIYIYSYIYIYIIL